MESLNDAPKNKIMFKKRAHRPWQPNMFEGTEDFASVTEVTPIFQDKQIEFLQKQLEATLEIKSKEREDLSHLLKTVDNHRITLGGFLRPKDIVLITDQASLSNTASVMSELKAKEQEIIELTRQLKITQAQELAKHAESSRLTEEKARQQAEEKAIFALRQAQQAAEQIQISEERVQALEQTKLKLANHVYDLEEKLTLATQELKVLGEKNFADETLRQELEKRVLAFTEQANNESDIHQSFSRQIQQLSEKLETENRIRIENENTLFATMEEIASLKQCIVDEKEMQKTLQGTIYELQGKIERMGSEEDLATAQQRITKMKEIIAVERNLRILFEEKMKEALLLAENRIARSLS